MFRNRVRRYQDKQSRTFADFFASFARDLTGLPEVAKVPGTAEVGSLFASLGVARVK